MPGLDRTDTLRKGLFHVTHHTHSSSKEREGLAPLSIISDWPLKVPSRLMKWLSDHFMILKDWKWVSTMGAIFSYNLVTKIMTCYVITHNYFSIISSVLLETIHGLCRLNIVWNALEMGFFPYKICFILTSTQFAGGANVRKANFPQWGWQSHSRSCFPVGWDLSASAGYVYIKLKLSTISWLQSEKRSNLNSWN